MAITWPSWLPIPKRVGHGYQQTDVIARSALNGGPDRVRQMSSQGPLQFPVSLQLKLGQWPMFEFFWANDLQRGAAEVLLPLETGVGVIARRARLVGVPAYDASDAPGMARANFNVEVLEPIEMDAGLYATVRDAYDGDMEAYMEFIDLLEIYINQQLPDSTMGA